MAEVISKPRIGRFRHGDTDTAIAAAHLAAAQTGNQRVRIIYALQRAGRKGLTNTEIGEIEGISDTAHRTRRKELEELGWVVDSGRRRMTPSGAEAIVWRLSPEAIERLSRGTIVNADVKIASAAKRLPRTSTEKLLRMVVECDCSNPCCKSIRKHIRGMLS